MLSGIDTEFVAYIGMFLILLAFFLETRNKLHSKDKPYLSLMAIGSALLAVRAYLIEEWAFLILELAWFSTAFVGILVSGSSKSTLVSEPIDEEIERKSSIDE
ncbi:MAG: hypothetical protein GWO84_05330 [Euryarchaeota archaeon]|nr:hypothetical protein [Euryarchaeota archaeon]